MWDKPFVGSTEGGIESLFEIGNARGGSTKDKAPPYYLSGDECIADIDARLWIAGPDIVLALT